MSPNILKRGLLKALSSIRAEFTRRLTKRALRRQRYVHKPRHGLYSHGETVYFWDFMDRQYPDPDDSQEIWLGRNSRRVNGWLSANVLVSGLKAERDGEGS